MNPVCEKLKNIRIVGNTTPPQWYKEIARESGKPDPVAVAILSDIWYWYIPRQVRDEKTGNVIQYRQRFKADRLQKSYQEYSNFFGFSKIQIKNAFDTLVRHNLVVREFRHITLDNGYTLSNVMFVEPVFDNVMKITNNITYQQKYGDVPEKVILNDSGCRQFSEDGGHKKVDKVPVKKMGCSPEKSGHNTETTTKNTTAKPPPAVFSEISFSQLLELIPVKTVKSRELWLQAQADMYGIDYLHEKIAYTNAKIKDRRKYWSFLGKAVEQNWAPGFLEDQKEIQAESDSQAQAEAQKAEIKRRDAEIEKQKTETEDQEYKNLRDVYNSLPPGIQTKIKQDFPGILNLTEKKLLRRNGLFPHNGSLSNLDCSFLDFVADFISGGTATDAET